MKQTNAGALWTISEDKRMPPYFPWFLPKGFQIIALTFEKKKILLKLRLVFLVWWSPDNLHQNHWVGALTQTQTLGPDLTQWLRCSEHGGEGTSFPPAPPSLRWYTALRSFCLTEQPTEKKAEVFFNNNIYIQGCSRSWNLKGENCFFALCPHPASWQIE